VNVLRNFEVFDFFHNPRFKLPVYGFKSLEINILSYIYFMKKVSLGKGLAILLVGLVGASCTKDVQEPMESTAVVSDSSKTITAASLSAVSATSTTTTTTTSVGTPIGFAATNGMTTGGAGGKTVTVTSLSALKTAAASTSPMIIKVSGTITGNEAVKVKSNKTIIGLSGATLKGPGLSLVTVSNVIIKNLRIVNPTASDAITIRTKSHHIWVDHVTLESPKYDGLLDITDESDYVTVSWSKMSGAAKNSLVGSSETSFADKGKLRVTYHHNYFLNDLERSPSLSFGTGHVFNNYYQNTQTLTNGYGIASRMGATIYAENNYFDGIKGAPIATIGTQLGYVGGVSTNVFKNCGVNKIKTAASSWKPSYSYKTALIAAANVPAAVKAGAGAK